MDPHENSTKTDAEWREQFLAERKEAGRHIDPQTAEVTWEYGQVCDAYGVYPDLPPEADCVGRNYFARAPGSDVWVAFRDLPQATLDALRARPPREEDNLFWPLSWEEVEPLLRKSWEYLARMREKKEGT